MGDMTWEMWLEEVADRMNVDVDDILGIRDVPKQLWDKGATPSEAADFLRLYC